jgi:hypothetical protein
VAQPVRAPANFAARVAIFRLPDGRIAEAWSLEDSLSRLLQLASSTARLREAGVPPPPVRTLPIQEVVPGLRRGPVPDAKAVHDLIRRFHGPS